jgi:pilus assembly protein CpaB
MKLFRNRMFLAVVSLILAAVLCFVAAPELAKASNRQTEIVRVVKTIPENTIITKDMVQTVRVGGYNLPSNVLKDTQDVIGKYAIARLEPGDYILSSKVSAESKSPYLSNLNGEQQAISISIKSFAAGLSGKLQSGDIISLIVSDYGESKQTIAPPELKYVKLLAATTAKGVDTDQMKQSNQSDDQKSEDDIPATLTLLVNPIQAEKLVDYEMNGKLYATLVYRGSEQTCQKYLDIQAKYFENSGSAESENVSAAEGAVSNGE